MFKETIVHSGVRLEVELGNIVEQNDADAIVNAANAFLRIGGGVAGAIHRKAGPEMEKEAMKLGPIKPGEAVITKGYDLPNKHVIHVLGPVYDRDIPHDLILANAYKNALELAEKNNIESIAFPAISTGAFGYPVEEAAEIALNTIYKTMPALKSIKRIKLVIYGKEDYKVHAETLKKL